MARHRKDFSDPRVIAELIAEGRGKGRNSQYKPWFQTNEVPSSGIRARVPNSHISGERVVHLLSNHETNTFFISEWIPDVTDIREQYPLLPLEETRTIADELGVKHPNVKGAPVVMTTDLLITRFVNGEEMHFARAIKEVRDLSPRSLEKLEIARVYHQRRKHHWGIITEREISVILAENLALLREKRDLARYRLHDLETPRQVEHVLLPLIWRRDLTLARACGECDKRLGLEPGTSLTVAYHFLYMRHWVADLTVPIVGGEPLSLVTPEPNKQNDVFLQFPAAVA